MTLLPRQVDTAARLPFGEQARVLLIAPRRVINAEVNVFPIESDDRLVGGLVVAILGIRV